ncbi:uncharacterized protein LOC131886276 [Tigriopus californicus]|nr:uncharacterized protein LOC131886276 [Tigriopus californicus]
MVLINAKSREVVSILVFDTIFQGGLLSSLVSSLKLFPLPSISSEHSCQIPIHSLVQTFSGTFWKLDLNIVFHMLSSPTGVKDSVNGLECTDIETERLHMDCHCSDEHLPSESEALSVVAIEPVELESFLHGDNRKSRHEADKKTKGIARPKRQGSISSSSSLSASRSSTTKMSTNRTMSRSTHTHRDTGALLGPEKDAVSRIRFNWNSE